MNMNFFKKIFHTPNYLSLPVAGIEICNKSIKYIEFFNKNGDFSVKNFGEVHITSNIIKDGEIINKNSLVRALIEVKSKITSDFVKVAIPEEKTYLFDTQVPREAINNIREALEFKIEENVPLKLAELFFEYDVMSDKPGKDILLNVSVIPKKVIADYTEVLNLAGMYPLSYEIESKMITSSVFSMNDKKNCIIINIKDDSTVFLAIIDGFVRLTSSIAIGESAIREKLLKDGLFSDELLTGKFFESDFSFETTYTKELYGSLINIFSVLKDEVERFNDYILNKFTDTKNSSNKNIGKIILCGRSSTLPGLAKYINQNLNADISLGDVWTNTLVNQDFSNKMKFSDSLSYVTAIGLVISSDKQINA